MAASDRPGPSGLRRAAHRLLAPLRHRRHGVLFVVRRAWRARRRRPGADDPPCPTVDIAALDPAAATVRVVHAPERIEVAFPDDLDPWLRGAPGWHTVHGVPAQVVVEWRDGCVLGGDGWFGPAPDVVCTDFNRGIHVGPVEPCRAAAAARAVGEQLLPGTSAALLVSGARNYYHWMLQALPMLSVLLGGTETAAVDRFLVPASLPPFVTETLDRAGIPAERRSPVPTPTPVLRCERLVTATTLLHHVPPPSWATGFVRSLFADEVAGGGDDLVYVGRGAGTNRRVLLNEDALVDALRAEGFRTVEMDGASVAEQAVRFATARCIVAVHGAALANLVFCRPGTRVVELLPANAGVVVYSLLSAQLGLDHRAVVGTEARPPRRLRSFVADADLRVDVDRVVRAAVGDGR